MTLVTDIQTGYFDRLSLTPVNRLSLLLDLMVADLALVVVLTLPVIALGLVTGVRFASGPLGMLAFIGLSGLWGVAYTGFPYTIALKTGNPAAVNTSFLLFLPFMFFTTAFLPKEVLTGWMAAIATYNPVTYLLDALRSLVSEGWVVTELMKGVIAIAAVWVVSHAMALAALRGRVRSR
jgi:ABC-2 type transport system permease protein